MTTQKLRNIYSFSLFLLDIVLIAVAFALAYRLRVAVQWPDPLNFVYPLSSYAGLMLLQITAVVITLFFYKQYYIPRAVSRVDQMYSVVTAVTIGTLMAVGISTFIFKSNKIILDFPRALVVYAWLLTIILLLVGRYLHQVVRNKLRSYGLGKDRLLIVGSGEMAQVIIQRIQWSPYLGYELVGVVNGNDIIDELQGVPILGHPEDLPTLIDEFDIDEVIIAMPEKGTARRCGCCLTASRGASLLKFSPMCSNL